MKAFLKYLRSRFISGLFATVPIIATFLALKFLFKAIDGLIGSLPERLFGYHIPGIGVLVTAMLILIMGLLASNLFGKRIIGFAEKLITSIPIVNKIYNASKELMQAVTVPNRTSFKAVVLVEYPRKGLYSYGFITSNIERRLNESTEPLINVYIPSVPVPTTGFLIAVPENELIRVNISIETALKLIVSGGIVSPKAFSEKKKDS